MKIKSLVPVILVLLLIFACKNNERPQAEDTIPESDVQFSPTPNEISRKDTLGTTENSSPEVERDENSTSGTGNNSRAVSSISSGNYIKTDQQADSNCGCYCIDVNLNSITELCLVKGAMYISARMEKSGQNINLYYVEPLAKNSEGNDIPWQDFDKNNPIATLTPKNNGEMKLDWLGFKINGDLAMDYAIYGKKTLEGTYKKK